MNIKERVISGLERLLGGTLDKLTWSDSPEFISSWAERTGLFLDNYHIKELRVSKAEFTNYFTRLTGEGLKKYDDLVHDGGIGVVIKTYVEPLADYCKTGKIPPETLRCSEEEEKLVIRVCDGFKKIRWAKEGIHELEHPDEHYVDETWQALEELSAFHRSDRVFPFVIGKSNKPDRIESNKLRNRLYRIVFFAFHPRFRDLDLCGLPYDTRIPD